MRTCLRAAAILALALLIATYRASTLLLHPTRLRVPPDVPPPAQLPFAYTWPLAHPMTVLGPWPYAPSDVDLGPLRRGDVVTAIEGRSVNWEQWVSLRSRLRTMGPGATVDIVVRRATTNGNPDEAQELTIQLQPEPWLPSDLGLDFHDVDLTTRKGDVIRGWYVPAGRHVAPLVVAFHGQAATRHSMLVGLGRALHDEGFHLLLIDSLGHGTSDGNVTDLVGIEEARAGLEWARAEPDVDSTRIVFIGHSYGGLKALQGAAAFPHVAAAVTIATPLTAQQGVEVFGATFLHIPWIWIASLMPFLSLWVRIRTGSWLRDADGLTAACHIDRPLLVIQGTDDELWGVETARTLYNASMGPKDLVIVPGADHNGLLVAGGPLVEPLTVFLREVFSSG